MKKIKIFQGSKTEEVIEEFNNFINTSGVKVCSFSHTYKNSKGSWGSSAYLYNIEIILIYSYK